MNGYMMSRKTLFRIVFIAVLAFLLFISVRGFFRPSSGPSIKTAQDLRRVESFLESYPSIVFFLHYRSLPDLVSFAKPMVPRLQNLNFVENLVIQRLGGPGWLVARETAGHFPYWTWMAFIPAGSEISALLAFIQPVLPRGVRIRTTDAYSGCQKGYIITGFEHPWGRSLEMQLCGSYVVVGPELYSWVDMMQQFMNMTGQLETKPQKSLSEPSLFTMWIDLRRIPSEALSPVFKARTARIAELMQHYVTEAGLYRIRVWPHESRYRWEIIGPWPPFQSRVKSGGHPLPD